jgi:hypothetical protein
VEAPVGRWFAAGYGAHGPLQLLERSSTTGTPFPIRSASALAISRFSLIRLLCAGVEELSDAGGARVRRAVPGASRAGRGPARDCAVLPEEAA